MPAPDVRRALEWSEGELDALSLPTRDDIPHADAAWRGDALPEARELLSAETLEDEG